MEAISFGIPVLATDVGGCREIVNNQTGILIKPSLTSESVAEKLKYFTFSELNNERFREGVREFWMQNFCAYQNYIKMFDIIDQ